MRGMFWGVVLMLTFLLSPFLSVEDLKGQVRSKGKTGVAAGGSIAPKPAAAATKRVTVRLVSEGEKGFAFVPPAITVKAGTTVQWVNESENKHSATDHPRFEKKKGRAVLPVGAETWDSGFFDNGGAYSRMFTVPGTYQYFCRNHEQYGMVGKIIVEP